MRDLKSKEPPKAAVKRPMKTPSTIRIIDPTGLMVRSPLLKKSQAKRDRTCRRDHQAEHDQKPTQTHYVSPPPMTAKNF